ncbi:MAG TPA: tetratricopeptide repeat protein [Kofleriaceae bacterium]|nr:tetratricopeptide repeat protein [Kofleriaceae bacterium]
MVSRLAIVLAIALGAAPALAQSTRYPPPPADPDAEAEHHSRLWEDALDPGRTPYHELVREARQLLDVHTPDAASRAADKLDRAIALLPAAPEAYAARGELEIWRQQWTRCADDLALADAHARPDDAERAQLELELGMCQGRAGKLADAERTLARAASDAPGRGDTWLRLGETRIALGKLDEAIGALDTALEAGDVSPGFVHFLLGAAYDRARRPGDAEQQIQLGTDADGVFDTIVRPAYPLLGAGEQEYLMGLAWRYGKPHPEYALLYFRRFVALAPQSPWRRRADDHLRELGAMDYPQSIEVHNSSARIDPDTVRASLRRAMPAMRACLARLPASVFEITVTRDGPRSPESARDRPRYHVPPPGSAVRDAMNLEDTASDAVDAAIRCVQPLVEKAPLPQPRESDTYYVVSFLLVGP